MTRIELTPTALRHTLLRSWAITIVRLEQKEEKKVTQTESDIRTAEYESLRQEMLQNKKYVFERPLVIIGAVGLAAAQLSGTPAAVTLPVLLVALLWLNLWFTANRLRSTARIVAYVGLVLEVPEREWIGWENALRLHRVWTKTHPIKDQGELIRLHLDPKAIPDAMMFYPILLWLHVLPVCVGIFASGLHALAIPKAPEIGGFILATLLGVGFAAICGGPFRPKRMNAMIEIQRAIWIVSLGLKIQGNSEDASHDSSRSSLK